VPFTPRVELYSRPRYGVLPGTAGARPVSAPVRIREIVAVGLYGATPEGGWSQEPARGLGPYARRGVTEEGPVGYGSAFTNVDLVRAALAQLEPLYRGASAIEPERTSEILHQNSFWLGRGGTLTHAISAIDIALWDLFGQATGQPVGRLLGGRYRDRVRPYASILMREPDPLAEELGRLLAQGFSAFKLGWGPFGRVSARLDESIVRAHARPSGPTWRSWSMPAAVTRSGRTATNGRSGPPPCSPSTASPGSRNRSRPTPSTTIDACASTAACRSPAARS
jgi:hypothetical protein